MEREILDLLILARAYLEFGFCQRTTARNAKGKPCTPHGPEAVRWCIMGALNVALEEVEEAQAQKVIEGVWRLLGTETAAITVYNDSHGREAVLALIDRACARLGKG